MSERISKAEVARRSHTEAPERSAQGMSNTIGAEIIDWLAEKGALVQFNNSQRHLLSIQIDDKFDRRVRPLQDALLLRDAIERAAVELRDAAMLAKEQADAYNHLAYSVRQRLSKAIAALDAARRGKP